MAWIGLEDTFYDNLKIKRLAKTLDIPHATAAGYMAMLWSWALRYAPDGIIALTAGDIETVLDWPGNDVLLVDAMLDNRLLEATQDGYMIHDWSEQFSSMTRAKAKRQERARKKTKDLEAMSHDSRTTVVRLSQDVALTRNVTTRNDTTQHKEQKESKVSQSSKKMNGKYTPQILEVFNHYRITHPSAAKKPSEKNPAWRKIDERLSEGRTVEELKLTIDGYEADKWTLDNNQRGLERYMRDDDHVTKGIEMATKPKKPERIYR